ncbi:hypothetical protein ZIOFF_015875 [Zingiber officinale]|uniref:Uncharacterized protein n=1 Tax=Zingiber officinale TaxID=94328 RepID=A0A8J5LMT3_ZINOF|nr:hypothetical protein ZIOFF_015875 [Zingiber officinale]
MSEFQLPYKAISHVEFETVKENLNQVAHSIGQPLNADTLFFKAPFEEVPELFVGRRVFLQKGFAYVVMHQVSVSLAKTDNLKDHRDALVELVASSEYGILHLFSHHQLQFTNLKYSRVEIDEVWFEWAECMLDYI